MFLLALLLSVAALSELYGALAGVPTDVLASVLPGYGVWFIRIPAPVHVMAGIALAAAAGTVLRQSGAWSWLREPLGEKRAERGRGVVALVLAATLVYLVGVAYDEIARLLTRPTDFGAFYTAAKAAAAGGDPYAATGGAYFYPPTFAHLLRPLTWLPPGGAWMVWFVLKLWWLALAAGLCFDFLGGPLLTPGRRVGLVFGLLATTARFWVSDLQFGNSNILILVLVTGVLVLDARGRQREAGICLAVAATIKVVPALLGVYLLARRRWRAAAWAGAVFVGLNLLPLVTGPEVVAGQWRAYVQTGVEARLADDLSQPDNQSLWGALGRMFPDASTTNRMAWGILSLVLVGAGAWMAGRAREVRRAALAASLWPGILLAVSPGSWMVHYVGIMLPMGALLRLVLGAAPPRRLYLYVFVAANLAMSISGWWRWSVRMSIEQSWYLVSLLAMLAAISIAVSRFPRHDGAPGAPSAP